MCLSWHVAFLLVSGVTILLSLTVFHNIVTEKLPRVSTAMPLLGAGQFSQKSFCCLTMLMSVRQIVSHVFMTIKLPENKHYQITFITNISPHRLEMIKVNLQINSVLFNLMIIVFLQSKYLNHIVSLYLCNESVFSP